MKTVLLIILALLLPPVAAFLVVGIRLHFWINLLLVLTIVAFPIAEIHAIYLLVTRRDSPMNR